MGWRVQIGRKVAVGTKAQIDTEVYFGEGKHEVVLRFCGCVWEVLVGVGLDRRHNLVEVPALLFC